MRPRQGWGLQKGLFGDLQAEFASEVEHIAEQAASSLAATAGREGLAAVELASIFSSVRSEDKGIDGRNSGLQA